jgi:hypothetical protein
VLQQLLAHAHQLRAAHDYPVTAKSSHQLAGSVASTGAGSRVLCPAGGASAELKV